MTDRSPRFIVNDLLKPLGELWSGLYTRTVY
jgi:hypothetical protein